MLPLTLQEVADACGGRLEGGDPRMVVRGVSTDTRRLARGDLFVGLRGERFDGDAHAAQALAAGAVAVMVGAAAARCPARRAPHRRGRRSRRSAAACGLGAAPQRGEGRGGHRQRRQDRDQRHPRRPAAAGRTDDRHDAATSTTRSACLSLCSASSRTPRSRWWRWGCAGPGRSGSWRRSRAPTWASSRRSRRCTSS